MDRCSWKNFNEHADSPYGPVDNRLNRRSAGFPGPGATNTSQENRLAPNHHAQQVTALLAAVLIWFETYASGLANPAGDMTNKPQARPVRQWQTEPQPANPEETCDAQAHRSSGPPRRPCCCRCRPA